MKGCVHTFDTRDGLVSAVESQWEKIADEAIADHGTFYVALAGGSTPRDLYNRLAQESGVEGRVWCKTQLYFGDERCVPQDHTDSNYRMARETLLSSASLVPEQIHAMFSETLSVEENVEKYANLLRNTLPKNDDGFPVFDLVLLGMGEDGHTASLFPDTEILHERVQPVSSQFVEKLNACRISLTFPTINAASHVAVLVAGDNKAKVMAEIYSSDGTGRAPYPIQQVNPVGEMDWYLDNAAAQLFQAPD